MTTRPRYRTRSLLGLGDASQRLVWPIRNFRAALVETLDGGRMGSTGGIRSTPEKPRCCGTTPSGARCAGLGTEVSLGEAIHAGSGRRDPTATRAGDSADLLGSGKMIRTRGTHPPRSESQRCRASVRLLPRRLRGRRGLPRARVHSSADPWCLGCTRLRGAARDCRRLGKHRAFRLSSGGPTGHR